MADGDPAAPPLATFRVLVAVERTPGRERVTGFAALSPSSDPDSHEADDAEVEEFVIDPERRGHGHGSRLMQAVVDTLRADRFTRATWWIRATDDRLRTFLTGAGWDATGPIGRSAPMTAASGSSRSGCTPASRR